MFGELLSTVVKVATLPLDVTNATLDIVTGGDGSKKSRKDSPITLSMLEEIRDELAKDCKKIDK